MQPVRLSEREARAAYAVLVRDLGAEPEGEEAFVTTCVAGECDQVHLYAAWPEVHEDDQRTMRTTYERTRFALVENPLRLIVSEPFINTSQAWAGESVSGHLAKALIALAAEQGRSRPFLKLRPSDLAEPRRPSDSLKRMV